MGLPDEDAVKADDLLPPLQLSNQTRRRSAESNG